MRAPRSPRLIASYSASLALVISLLVVWVIYVERSGARVQELAHRVGVTGGRGHWVVLTIGCILFGLLIVGITLQLAQAVAAGRYSRAQDELVASITHELKSPLAAIKLHAQTLEQRSLDADERRRSVAYILQEAERMARLVDNVLESSRLVGARAELELDEIGLGPFLDAHIATVRPRVESHGVTLDADTETEATVLASEEALARIVDNLLDNAAHHSPDGGQVSVRVVDGDGSVRIEVSDEGVGVPKGELGRIFDRFYRLKREHGGGAGSGLGLYIVSRLVEQMRGEVRAVVHEGRPGTTFVVEVPTVGERA